MPFDPNSGGQAPKVPHLGIITDDTGEMLAVPPGTGIYIVEDSTNASKYFPMVLHSVSHTKIAFQCQCRDPNCNRVYEYRLTKGTGRHHTEEDRVRASRAPGKKR